jgi:hypothetical protein
MSEQNARGWTPRLTTPTRSTGGGLRPHVALMEDLASYGLETATFRMEWDGSLEWDILDATVRDEAEAS